VPLHLYGVIASPQSVKAELSGRGDERVRCIEEDGLVALVSDVAEDARVGRADLLAHAHVLEATVADTTVVPAQFGVVFPDEEQLRTDLLRQQKDDLQQLISGLEGFVQLTLQASHIEEEALREVMRRDPDLVGLRDAARSPGAGNALQVKLGEAVADGLEALKAERADLLLDRVAPHARAVAVNEARGAHDVLNVALLVERARQPALDEQVMVLREEFSDRMRIRYVGPQPAYSFLEPLQNGEL
jgi:hypothetical protein